jgi:GNAT superfamily N-acetyltransferase
MANDELRPFAAAEAEQVASWAVSAEDCTSLTGSPSAVSADDIALWTMEANWAFTLRLDGDLVAYGEIMEDEVEGDVEVQHLLVAPDMRGKGVGRTLLAHLCTRRSHRCRRPRLRPCWRLRRSPAHVRPALSLAEAIIDA